MDYLSDKANSWQSKMVLLVERGMSVGCTNHSEETLRWALAMMLLSQVQHVSRHVAISTASSNLMAILCIENNWMP